MRESVIRIWRTICAATLLALLAACASSQKSGGYYQNDGPGTLPANLHAIPDAVPRIEPFAPANLRTYTVEGRRFVPIADNRGFRQEGLASWYGKQFHGKSTANGETYDMYAMTAAHPRLPIPSYARVTRKSTGQSVIVRINDRGPFRDNRIIDLSYVAAAKLGIVASGTATVIVEAIDAEQIRAGTFAPVASAEPVVPPAPVAPIAPAVSAVSAVPTAAPPPASPTRAQVFLQFGAFSVPDNAQRLAARLQNLQQNAGVRQGGDGLYRVLVGPYASRDAARGAARAIAQDTGLSSVIALN